MTEEEHGNMRKCNIIAVLNPAADRVLMCLRRKAPYKGLLNFVGGKICDGEAGADAAYRELAEETAIMREDIILTHLMDFTYYAEDLLLEVYVGKLNKQVAVHGEENDLCWCGLNENFADASKFAGRGNIEHIMQYIALEKEALLR